jgi:hypothetical protein
MTPITDLILPALFMMGCYLAAAVGLRRAGQVAYARLTDALHMGKDFMPRSWRPRHALYSGRLALVAGVLAVHLRAEASAPAAVSQPAPEPDDEPTPAPAAAADTEHVGADDDYADLLHALVEETKAEQTGERPVLPLTGELAGGAGERNAVTTALQERTAVLPVLDLHTIIAERQTRAEFDALVAHDQAAAALLAEARSSLTWNTGSHFLVGAR